MTLSHGVRRLFLVDHLLRDNTGHHAGYNAALAAAATRASVQPVVCCHRLCPAGLVPGVDIQKIFHDDWRSQPLSLATRSQRLLRVLEKLSAMRFASDLRSMPSDVGADDMIFCQMIAPRHFVAWLQYLGRFNNPPRIVLHLGYQPWRFERREVRHALASLPAVCRRQLSFVTDSEKLVDPFAKALGAEVRHLPHVVDWKFRPGIMPLADIPVFVVPGNAREEKGFVDLMAALSVLRPALEQNLLRFKIQCHEPDPPSTQSGAAAPPQTPGVEWIREPLGREAYYRMISEAHAIVLPYHLSHYAMRTSGVFCEARCAGRPVIATRGSWAGDRIEREGGGWTVEENNPRALASCLREAASDGIMQKTAEAISLQEASQREFSPDKFVYELLEVDSSFHVVQGT